jgi:hypothetical protein
MPLSVVTVEDVVASVDSENADEPRMLSAEKRATFLAAAEEAFRHTLSGDPIRFVARSRQRTGE